MSAGITTVRNHIGGDWNLPSGNASYPVWNPSNGATIANVRASSGLDIEQAVRAATRALPEWRRCPPNERSQFLFRLKNSLEDRMEELARSITLEHGKLIAEARGEVRRAIENVDMACCTPVLLQGRTAEDISAGVDEALIRQPVGVCAAIVPFNFPLMIPCWFLPYAIGCGNTFILKASERTPCTAEFLFSLLDEIGLPPGVVNLIHGGLATAEMLIEHPKVRAISFVGSTPAARSVYAAGSTAGKRVQAQGGAKNSLVIMPDSPMEKVATVVAESTFGNAGQRCLAGGSAIVVGGAPDEFVEVVTDLALARTLGDGLDESAALGPVITAESVTRIGALVTAGALSGGRLLVDGRNPKLANDSGGFYFGATVVDQVEPENLLAYRGVWACADDHSGGGPFRSHSSHQPEPIRKYGVFVHQ